MASRRPVILLLSLIGLVPLFVVSCRDGSSTAGMEQVTIKDRQFALEIAADTATIQRGLMFRETIPDGTGMLFIFPDAQLRGFWMKNCLSDIDIIFLDGGGRVTATHRMKTQPPKRADETEPQYELRMTNYSSVYPAQFAIELPPGSLDQLNVRVEDKIELNLDRLKALTD